MIIKLKNWLKKYWHWIILVAATICFFISTASFNYFTQSENFVKWMSPDEAANYNFTKLYAQEGRLMFFEKYNLLASDIIHPRSVRSDFGWLKPVSFLGIILIYGKIASITTYKILPFLTPFFAALGIIFYYLLIKEIFGKRNALISALILTVFPPFVYYSARSMFHNVLFVVLLVISLYFACVSVKKKKIATDINKINILPNSLAGLSGVFLGLAIITRSSELIWIAPIWLIIWLFNIKKFGFIKLIIFIACLLFAISPAMYWNKILYQSYWRGGYNEMNQSILNIAGAGSEILKSKSINSTAIKNGFIEIKNNFFHFGLWPAQSFKMLYFYFIKMFYWIFWPALFGFLLLLSRIKKWRTKHYAFLLSLFTAAAILILYYGSWNFYDNPDPGSHTIGNSYTRYWLPIYLGAIPLAVIFLVKLSNIFRFSPLIKQGGGIFLFRALIIILVFFISIKFVLFGSDEGLIKSAQKHLAVRAEYEQILNLTENRAIIITQYHDKLLFPARKVIVGLFDDPNMIKQYAVLAQYLPIYYYNFTFPERDINYLNNRKLSLLGLQIKAVAQITKDFTLYKLSL
ncbi:glycosyltransferase family 39 protein [Patescibacteria group bacterium]|nr:glycosyltransferase family 39 protein [Patescibacteria group bacterium]MBU1663381.1 glycosyltransferase family 39 protein [Patescibacteria group bacterium]MBU1934330.1 glycosyltransferase family 39 protein [Patescibacteria group bacterium]MBU2007623.1 glycosyltransferase family 39 protein [Patescibacteria group bacterium]MBU2233368.1 glycosyltransferase family 39 protein [Patescibacteria group bacterium]